MVNRAVLPIFIGFFFLLCCFEVQRGLADQTVMTSSDIKQRMVETVVPPYCTAYTTLNERIVQKLLAVQNESDERTVQTLVNSLLCAAKNVHDQLRKATEATEPIRNTIDEQITQLVHSISDQEERVRQSQEAVNQANGNIHHAQHQVNVAEAAVHDSQNSLNAANHALHEAHQAVEQARRCGMGRRRKRFLGSFLRELNPVRIFRNVIGKPLCSVINSGGIDNAKERRALTEGNLHQAQQRLHSHQQHLASQRAQYDTALAQHNAANIQLQTITSALNEQRAKQSLVTSLTKQIKDVEVHLSNVLGSSAVLQDEISRLVDFELVIEPLNNIYHEMLKNDIMKSFDFEISDEQSRQINTNLRKLTEILPRMPLNTLWNADTGKGCSYT
jgi:chromosome segregation ATPase